MKRQHNWPNTLVRGSTLLFLPCCFLTQPAPLAASKAKGALSRTLALPKLAAAKRSSERWVAPTCSSSPLQLASPDAPVFHSLLHAWADPRTATCVEYPLDSRARYAPVETAHNWCMPGLGGAFGTKGPELGSWQSVAKVVVDTLLVGLAGAGIITIIGLRDTFTRLYSEAIILDDDLFHRALYSLLDRDVGSQTLAVDVIARVKPGGRFLSQKYTRKHTRPSMVRGVIICSDYIRF